MLLMLYKLKTNWGVQLGISTLYKHDFTDFTPKLLFFIDKYSRLIKVSALPPFHWSAIERVPFADVTSQTWLVLTCFLVGGHIWVVMCMPGEVSIYISCVHFARKTQKQRRQLEHLIRHLMCSKYNGKHRQYKGTLIILGYSGVWKACNVNLSHCVEAYCPTLVELVLKGTWWTMDIHQKSDSLWTRLLSRIKQNLATFEKVVESTSPPPDLIVLKAALLPLCKGNILLKQIY